jgi:hypothetical protein
MPDDAEHLRHISSGDEEVVHGCSEELRPLPIGFAHHVTKHSLLCARLCVIHHMRERRTIKTVRSQYKIQGER